MKNSIICRFIPNNEWNGIIPEKQNIYLEYLADPNAYFFRSTMKCYEKRNFPFSDDEILLFDSRMKYFRNDLGIEQIPWGFFSIAIPGRAGYQCAAYYRESIINKKYKEDIYYPICKNGYPKGIFNEKPPISRYVTAILEREAFDIVNNHIEKHDLSMFKSKKELHIKKIVYHKPTTQLPHYYHKVQDLEIGDNDFSEAPEEIKPANIIQSDEFFLIMKDPITKTQIKNPMMDINGFVMDAHSWTKCLQNPSISPIKMTASSMRDLISINNQNIKLLYHFITNKNPS